MSQNQRLNLDMSVADLLSEWPQLIPVFLQHQMACAGCHMSAFETLGEAANVYGIVPEAFLDELYQVIGPAA